MEIITNEEEGKKKQGWAEGRIIFIVSTMSNLDIDLDIRQYGLNKSLR